MILWHIPTIIVCKSRKCYIVDDANLRKISYTRMSTAQELRLFISLHRFTLLSLSQ